MQILIIPIHIRSYLPKFLVAFLQPLDEIKPQIEKNLFPEFFAVFCKVRIPISVCLRVDLIILFNIA